MSARRMRVTTGRRSELAEGAGRQAAAALTRGRRPARTVRYPEEIPGQLSIDDVLVEVAAEADESGGGGS